jgi:hypothetical protein
VAVDAAVAAVGVAAEDAEAAGAAADGDREE